MYRDILKAIDQLNITIDTEKSKLANLAMYDLLQNPVLKNKYDFINLYKNIDDDLMLGIEKTEYKYHYGLCNLDPNIDKKDTDSYALFDNIVSEIHNIPPELNKDYANLMINEKEKIQLVKLLEKIDSSSSIKVFESLLIKDIALLEKIGFKKLSDIVDDTTNVEGYELINGIQYNFNNYIKKTFDTENNSYKRDMHHFLNNLENKPLISLMSSLIENKNLNLNIDTRSGDFYAIMRCLEMDNIDHLLSNKNIGSIDALNKFKNPQLKDTNIGILLSDDLSIEDKFYKLYDKNLYPSIKEKTIKLINEKINEPNIENYLENNKVEIDFIKKFIVEKYPEMKGERTIVMSTFSGSAIKKDKIEEEKCLEMANNEYENLTSKIGVFSEGNYLDLQNDLRINGIHAKASQIEENIFKSYKNSYFDNELISFKDGLETFGIITLRREHYGIHETKMPINQLSFKYLNDDEIKAIYQQVINHCKQEQAILHLDATTVNNHDDSTMDEDQELTSRLSTIYYELQELNKNDCIIFVMANDDDIIEKQIIIEQLKEHKLQDIPHKDLLQIINEIDKFIYLENSRYINDDRYEEIINDCINNFQKKTPKNTVKSKNIM